MSAVFNCSVVNCGKQFRDERSLKIHIARKHSSIRAPIKRVEVTASSNEIEKWEQSAKEHNFSNLASFIKFYMREGVSGAEQIRKLKLEKQYKEQIDRIEKEKKKLSDRLESVMDKLTDKKPKPNYAEDVLTMLESCEGYEEELKKIEENFVSNKLIEEEWEDLTVEQKERARELMDDNKTSLVKAIAAVGGGSRSFRMFFDKELKK
jgi:hypothetical protein